MNQLPSNLLSTSIKQVHAIIAAIPDNCEIWPENRDLIADNLENLGTFALALEGEVNSLRTLLLEAASRDPESPVAKEIIRQLGGVQ